MSSTVKTFQTTFFNGISKGCRKIFSHTDVISAVVIPREFRNEIKTHIGNEVHPKSWTQPLRCIFYEERTQNKPSV